MVITYFCSLNMQLPSFTAMFWLLELKTVVFNCWRAVRVREATPPSQPANTMFSAMIRIGPLSLLNFEKFHPWQILHVSSTLNFNLLMLPFYCINVTSVHVSV